MIQSRSVVHRLSNSLHCAAMNWHVATAFARRVRVVSPVRRRLTVIEVKTSQGLKPSIPSSLSSNTISSAVFPR